VIAFSLFALSIRDRNDAPEVDVHDTQRRIRPKKIGEVKNQGAYLTRLEAIATFCHPSDCEMMAV
jgi:hypothetical protein